MSLQIKQAAIKDSDGKVHTLPRPARHHTIIHSIYDTRHPMGPDDVQGFILDDDTFVDRIEGARVALESKQIDKLKWPPNLYSEDLW